MQEKGLDCARAKQGKAKDKGTPNHGCEEEEDTSVAKPQLVEIDRVLPKVGLTDAEIREWKPKPLKEERRALKQIPKTQKRENGWPIVAITHVPVQLEQNYKVLDEGAEWDEEV